MAYGFDPYLSEQSPYHGAYCAVVESVCKLIAAGASFEDVYLTFQEYFEKPRTDAKRWGKPFPALLGAFEAQMRLGIAAIGGKDSMSGLFEDLDVPPTLVSFAVTTAKVQDIVSPEFKKAGNKVILLRCKTGADGLPDAESLKALFDRVHDLQQKGIAVACYTPTMGGIAEAVMKTSFGNGFGFDFDPACTSELLFDRMTGAFVLEVTEPVEDSILLGTVTDGNAFRYRDECVPLEKILNTYEDRLESVFKCNIGTADGKVENITCRAENYPAPAVLSAKPRVLIPVFPGTNCEYDSAKAVERAGCEAELLVINNLTGEGIMRSTQRFCVSLSSAQMIFLPGGFSGGDEPDGSGKFITAFFRNANVKDGVMRLLDEHGGLICGICNGFQALVKLGLVPYGKIIDTDENCPTLTYNTIGRHQSRIVRTRIASNKSPWLRLMQLGDVVNVPISHGEGRFIASDAVLKNMIANGQIATQYVDLDGNASMDVAYNPNGSMLAIEGITSPDGRVFGKIRHSERIGEGLYKNVPGCYNIRMFEAAKLYFKG